MKAFTDLEQSKKLAEILPLESADMYWFRDDFETPKIYPLKMMHNSASVTCPCWSLAALLDILPYELGVNSFLALQKEKNECCCCYEDINGDSFRHTFGDNPVDACYEMILKLHEMNLL